MDFEFLPLVALLAGILSSFLATGLLGQRKGRRDILEDVEFSKRVVATLRQHPGFSEEQLAFVEKSLVEATTGRTVERHERRYLIFVGVAGLLGILFALYRFLDYIGILASLLITTAYAQPAPSNPASSEMAWMMPWIVGGILVVMAIAFVGSIVTLLMAKDTPENQSKLKAATDIVKTFGGFFTGIATSLLH